MNPHSERGHPGRSRLEWHEASRSRGLFCIDAAAARMVAPRFMGPERAQSGVEIPYDAYFHRDLLLHAPSC